MAHRFTVDEYMKMSEAGLLWDCRTELIDGQILETPAQDDPHMIALSKTSRVLVAAFDEEHYWLKVLGTSRLDRHNAPDPDFTVLEGPPSPRGGKPDEPLLVVEVSHSTLLYDQNVKGSLYASRGIQDYWIINVEDGQVEVYRDPVRNAASRFGWRYALPTVVRAPGFVSPLCKPRTRIAVARMLP